MVAGYAGLPPPAIQPRRKSKDRDATADQDMSQDPNSMAMVDAHSSTSANRSPITSAGHRPRPKWPVQRRVQFLCGSCPCLVSSALFFVKTRVTACVYLQAGERVPAQGAVRPQRLVWGKRRPIVRQMDLPLAPTSHCAQRAPSVQPVCSRERVCGSLPLLPSSQAVVNRPSHRRLVAADPLRSRHLRSVPWPI